MTERAFVKWATKHNVLFPTLGFADLPCCGRSVIAHKPVSAGHVVVTVCTTLVHSLYKCLHPKYVHACPQVPDDMVLLLDNCCIAEVGVVVVLHMCMADVVHVHG